MNASRPIASACAALLATASAFANVIKPVSVTTNITGDAGSSHLYLLDDNGGQAAASLQDDMGTAVTLDTGDTMAKAVSTCAYRAGDGHQESWTRGTGSGNPVFVFDLTGGGDTAVGSAILWQYGNNGGPGTTNQGNSTREFSIIMHTEAEGDSFDFDTETVDVTGTMDSIPGDTTLDNFAQTFFFGTQSNVRYVALRIDSNYLGQPGITNGGDRYGLGEVRFATEEVVDPEIVLPESITIANNGATETIQVTITNNGPTQNLNVSDIRISGPDAGAFTVLSALPPAIAPSGGTALIDIEVHPATLPLAPTPIDATLEVDSDGWFLPTVTAPIDGLVRDPWISTVDTIDLGTILPSAGVQTFTIDVNNLGASSDLTVSDAFFTTGPDFAVDDDLVTTPLVVDTSGTPGVINLSFDSGGAAGVFSDTLELDSDDLGEPIRIVNVTVNIERDPEISVPAVVDLGTFPFGTGPQMFSVQVTNNGAANPLILSPDPAVFGGTDANFTVDSFDTPIAAGGGTGDINLTFNPMGAVGYYSTTLEISSNDPGVFFTTDVQIIAKVDPQTLPGGLVAWWSLDDDLEPGKDNTGNGFDGAPVGTPTTTPGANANTGTALAFSGTAHIDVPWTSYLNPESFTVTLWANATTTGGYQSPITSRDDTPSATYGLILYNDNAGNWTFWTGDGDPGWHDSTNGGAVTTGVWTHLAISYDSTTGTKTIYVNGSPAHSESGAGIYAPNGPQMEDLHIGSGQDNGLNFYFQGSIDDVAVFNTALSPGDISTIMNGGVAGFLSPGSELDLVVNGYNAGTGQLSVSINNIPSGETFHLRSSTDLQTFSILSPVVDFDENTAQPLLIPASGSKFFLQAYEGPSVP